MLINALLGGESYADYQAYIQGAQNGTVSDGKGATWQLDLFTVTSQEYTQAGQALQTSSLH